MDTFLPALTFFIKRNHLLLRYLPHKITQSHRIGLLLIAVVGLLPASAQAVTLDECVAAALKINPTTSAAAFRVEAARSSIKQAQAAFYPRLFMSGNYLRSNNPTQAFMMQLNQRQLDMRDPLFDPNNPDDTDNLRFTLGLKYRLFDGGKRFNSNTAAKLGQEAVQHQLAAIQNELIHQVTRGFYNLLQAQDFVSVQKESVESLARNLSVASQRYKAGSAVKTDVLNLEVKLAQSQEDLIRAQNGVLLAVAALNTAIGDDLVEPQGLPVPSKEVVTSPPIDIDMAAVEDRPELQATHNVVDIREQDFIRAKREYIPTIDAFGTYDWDSGDLDRFEDSYTVGLMAEWEFFSGFSKPNTISKSRQDWYAAQQQELEVRNRLKLDLRQTHLTTVESWQRLAVAQKSVVSAEEALRITRVRYQEGAADITELLTAQVGLTATRSRNVAAYYDYLIALSNLERARGALLSKYDLTRSSNDETGSNGGKTAR